VVSETIEAALDGGVELDQIRLVFYEVDDLRLFLQNQRFTSR
jgi:hypothetical protein